MLSRKLSTHEKYLLEGECKMTFILSAFDKRGYYQGGTFEATSDTLLADSIKAAGDLCNGFRNIATAQVFDMNDKQVGSVG